jgi:hypothetical protein
MIGFYSADEEPTHWIGERAAETKAIRQKWTVSGMYRNDGSVTPLWTVDWYAYLVDVPADGEHVVRYKFGSPFGGPGPALGFYRRGELVRGYEMSDLVTFAWLSEHGGWLAEHRLSDDSRTLTVETKSGDRYVFDVQTGEMLERFRPVRYAVIGAMALAVLVGVWWIRRRRQRNAARGQLDRDRAG